MSFIQFLNARQDWVAAKKDDRTDVGFNTWLRVKGVEYEKRNVSGHDI